MTNALTHTPDVEPQPLPRWLRAVLALVGLGFLLIGLVMLAIPVLPQVWAFALAAVCFSLASHALWGWLERKLRHFPRLHAGATAMRNKALAKLARLSRH